MAVVDDLCKHAFPRGQSVQSTIALLFVLSVYVPGGHA